MPPAGAANATGTVDEQRGRPSCGHHVRRNEVDCKAYLRQTRILLLLLLLSPARSIPHQILPAPPFPPSPSRLHRVVAGRKVRRPLPSPPSQSSPVGSAMSCVARPSEYKRGCICLDWFYLSQRSQRFINVAPIQAKPDLQVFSSSTMQRQQLPSTITGVCMAQSPCFEPVLC